jgi:hypothetical protein
MPRKVTVSIAYGLLLLCCAFFACFAVFGFAFAIGDGGGTASPPMEVFFDVTLAGAALLLIAALGCWAHNRVLPVVALVSILLVLPASALSCRSGITADWYNSSHNSFHPSLFAWVSDLLPVPLDLAALVWSAMRFRDPLRAARHSRVQVSR